MPEIWHAFRELGQSQRVLRARLTLGPGKNDTRISGNDRGKIPLLPRA
jgi:hypothetical protein